MHFFRRFVVTNLALAKTRVFFFFFFLRGGLNQFHSGENAKIKTRGEVRRSVHGGRRQERNFNLA